MPSSPQSRRILVIGGGASGLMAAGTAGARGLPVAVLERNREIGRKLHISGKGRCNITNDTTLDCLLANIPGNPRFLRHAFYRFTPQDVMAFFTQHGVPVKTERGGRVFPASDDADDIVNALRRYCDAHHVRIQTEVTVKRVTVEDNRVTGVVTADGRVYGADAVILATGGASYPGTGSRGDGYRMAEALGHTLTPIHPSLVPIETEETWSADAQGLSLRNVRLTAFAPDGKKLYSEIGEMLFTHYGVSGPLVLTASRHVGTLPGSHLAIDLKPGLDEQELDARIQRDFALFHRKQFENALDELLPKSLIPIIVRLSAISPETPVHQITREARRRLARLLKALTVTVKRTRSLVEAIVTAGGVSTREITPTTMESKLVHGLFFIGEVIDVDGYTGGFNLQIAWSTGHLAGESVGA